MPESTFAHPKRLLIGGIALLALATGAALAWLHGREVPAGDVAAFLDGAAGAGRVRFTVNSLGSLSRNGATLEVAVDATARNPAPLYAVLDTADYLRRTIPIDPESTAEARRILAGNGGSQAAGAVEAGPVPTDPFRATVLQLKAPAGTPFGFHGIVDARRDRDAWAFSLVTGGFDGTGPQGQVRSAFDKAAFEAGNPQDDARLQALCADLQAFAGRLQESRRNIGLAQTAAHDRRRDAFLSLIAPGRVFTGQALETGEQVGTPLTLEITDLSPNGQVSALLRNEGSWHFARAFVGAWSADDGFEHPVLTLTSTPEQAIRKAGPFLETTQTWSLALQPDPQGGLSDQDSFYRYQFQPMDPSRASALKARLEAEFDGALAATEPGSLYQGTAVSRDTGASEPILLRFARRSEQGESIEGTIESTTRSWKRSFQGTIIANARRSDGAPIRLLSAATDAGEDALPASILGDPDDLDLHFRVEDGALVGGNERYACRLATVEGTDSRQLEAGRTERARRFLGILRKDINYDGLLRDDQGAMIYARLEVCRLDRGTGAIEARIHSLTDPGVFRDFAGTADPAGGSIVLAATNQGHYYSQDTISIPFLMGPSATTLHLALNDGGLAGRIVGDPHWTMEFPVNAFLTAPVESLDPNAPPASGSVFPSFPKEAGAYLLGHGAWIPLPKNQGHVIVDEGMASKFLDAVTFTKDKPKAYYLEFPGKDPRPRSSDTALVLLSVGPLPPDGARPVIELAPTDTLKDGPRRVQVLAGPPAPIRFGEQRVAAYVRQVAPRAVLLTTTSPLAPGPYAVDTDGGDAYELIRE